MATSLALLITLLLLLLLFLFLCAFLYELLFVFLIPMFLFGAVFAKSSSEIVTTMVQLALEKPVKKAADLGSGDGRLVIALASAGIEAHGYEINPWLVYLSRRKIKKLGLSSKAFVHWQSFWSKDFSEFDVITLYAISYVMGALEKKLRKELKRGARVISNYFVFSGWPHEKKRWYGVLIHKNLIIFGNKKTFVRKQSYCFP